MQDPAALEASTLTSMKTPGLAFTFLVKLPLLTSSNERTETKAITVYPVKELLGALPKFLHPAVRSSKYYTAGNDSLTFSAQTHRSRSANLDENKRKLIDEVMSIYRDLTPAETSSDKKKKYQEVYVYKKMERRIKNTKLTWSREKRFHETRVQDKKFNSAKKQSRRGPPE